MLYTPEWEIQPLQSCVVIVAKLSIAVSISAMCMGSIFLTLCRKLPQLDKGQGIKEGESYHHSNIPEGANDFLAVVYGTVVKYNN